MNTKAFDSKLRIYSRQKVTLLLSLIPYPFLCVPGESALSQSDVQDAGNPLCYTTTQDLDLNPELRTMPGDTEFSLGAQVEWLLDPKLEGTDTDCDAMGFSLVKTTLQP